LIFFLRTAVAAGTPYGVEWSNNTADQPIRQVESEFDRMFFFPYAEFLLKNVMNSKLPTGLEPLPRATLSEQVAKRLAARIAAGDWQPGEKLPSEAVLCKAFNVGRSSLREALTSLSFIGLIRVRPGGGSYVAEQPSAYLTSSWLKSGRLADEKTLREFVEARLFLETEVAGLCAERITPEELDEMELLVEQMKTSVHDSIEFSRLDMSFHLCVGIAAKNEVLNSILSDIREQSMELITKSLLLEEGMENALQGHIKVFEAVRQHNPVKARRAMRTHLQLFQRGYYVLFENQELNKG
jgi:GntR family transcriptional repressor for pyruvate dehydrogenase complex